MQLPAEVTADLVRRLHRIEGQVRGIAQMLEDGRECRDVVAQVSAVAHAVDRVGFKLLFTGLHSCAADPDQAASDGFDLAEVERLFLKLA